MADALLYQHTRVKKPFVFDFTDDLADDTALKGIGSGSDIDAVDSKGTDVSSTILTNKTVTGMTLVVDIHDLIEGEEYVVTFEAQGSTTLDTVIRVLKLLARDEIEGSI